MLLIPISCVGLDEGPGAPSFDVSYAPKSAAQDERAASAADAALRDSTGEGASAAAVALRPGADSRPSSAATAAAEDPDRLHAGPTTTTTTSPPPRAKAGDAATPSRPPSPFAVNLPVDLGSTLRSLTGQKEHGEASWFDAPDGTCAHQTLPFGTLLKVTSLHDGTTTTCEVDDRGPFIEGRIIDLSYDTFEKLAHPGSGVIDVVIEVVSGS